MPSPIPARIDLPAAALDDVLLARALEEADVEGVLATPDAREAATEAARGHLDDPRRPSDHALAQFLGARAKELRAQLPAEAGALRPVAGEGRRATAPLGLAVLGLFVLGAATSSLGRDGVVHVLANPLMALLLWNVAMLFGLLALRLFGRGDDAFGLAGRLARWTEGRRARRVAPEGLRELHTRVRTRWQVERAAALHPVWLARARSFLHLAAIALILGSLAGLYLRGLVFAYRMTWESTFLSAESAQRFADTFFAPASRLSGLEVPPITAVDHAATWIHLYGLSVVLFVLIPRAAFAWAEARRARRSAAALSFASDGPWVRRVLATLRASGGAVRVVPYSHRPSAASRDRLLALLHEALGARTRIGFEEPVEYGAEADEIGNAIDAEARLVLCFALAQTPEVEVHGRVCADLARGRGEAPLVVVDGTGYRERLGGGSEAQRRADEHVASWNRVLERAGLACVHVAFDAPRLRDADAWNAWVDAVASAATGSEHRGAPTTP